MDGNVVVSGIRRPLTAWPNLTSRIATVAVQDTSATGAQYFLDPRDALEFATKLIEAANACFDQRWKPEVIG